MTLTVNGVNLIPYVAFGGFKWKESDIDAKNAGRAMDALMYRSRIASKIRLDITCRPLTTQETSIVLSAIYPEFVTVTYTDPHEGKDVTKSMYSNNRPASHLISRPNNKDLWGGITFPLIER